MEYSDESFDVDSNEVHSTDDDTADVELNDDEDDSYSVSSGYESSNDGDDADKGNDDKPVEVDAVVGDRVRAKKAPVENNVELDSVSLIDSVSQTVKNKKRKTSCKGEPSVQKNCSDGPQNCGDNVTMRQIPSMYAVQPMMSVIHPGGHPMQVQPVYPIYGMPVDSLPSVEREHHRRHQILLMAIFLEELLLDDSFSELRPQCPANLVTKFCHVQPYVPQQRLGSNDCGVWVAKWMIECAYRSDYENVTVVTATRMKLALYLVHSANNVLLNQVVSRAANYWDFQQKKRKALVKV